MTVSSSLSTQTFNCNGSTTVFTCPFRVLEASEVVGYLITVATNASVQLVNGADFSVTGVGAANAIVTTTATYSSAYQVNFRRRTQRLQLTDYRDNDPFPAESHESALDRLTHIVQEHDADIGRALLAPEPETGITLPSAASRANLLLGFNSTGAPVAVAPVGGSAAALAMDLASTATGKGGDLSGFKQSGASAADRTVGAKLRELYSAADATTLAGAVASVYAAGGALYFPAGTIASAASIPNLHDVPKWGPGSITRGSDVFYASPTAAQTNRLYVSASGSNTNDGLSAAQPMQTLQAAFDALAKYGPSLPGIWEIILAAGTYSAQATFPENVRGQNRVLIRGPLVNHPNVSTAIIDGGGTQVFGVNFNGNNKVTLSNLLLRNCTTYGWVAQDFCDITTVNVHISGITGGDGGKMQQGRLRVQGGIIQTCAAYGLNLISGTTMTVGDAAVSLATGPQIRNCAQGGILAQENTTGHTDYVTIDNCAVGLDVVGSSRVHAAACDIKNNATAGVRTRAASHWFNNASTLTGNAVNELNYGFSMEIGGAGNFVSALRATGDTAQVTHTGSTAETTLKTYTPGVRRNSFVWGGRSLRVVITGQFTGGSSKTLRVKVGGNLIHGLATSAAGFFRYEGSLRAIDSANQSYDAQLITNGAAVVADGGSRAINMAGGSDQSITISGQLAAGGDSIVVSNVEVWETA